MPNWPTAESVPVTGAMFCTVTVPPASALMPVAPETCPRPATRTAPPGVLALTPESPAALPPVTANPLATVTLPALTVVALTPMWPAETLLKPDTSTLPVLTPVIWALMPVLPAPATVTLPSLVAPNPPAPSPDTMTLPALALVPLCTAVMPNWLGGVVAPITPVPATAAVLSTITLPVPTLVARTPISVASTVLLTWTVRSLALLGLAIELSEPIAGG